MKTELLALVLLAALTGCESGQPVGESSGCYQGSPYPTGPDPSCIEADLPTVVRWFECRYEAETFANTHEIIRMEDVPTSSGWHVYYCCEYRCR